MKGKVFCRVFFNPRYFYTPNKMKGNKKYQNACLKRPCFGKIEFREQSHTHFLAWEQAYERFCEIWSLFSVVALTVTVGFNIRERVQALSYVKTQYDITLKD